MKLLNLKINDDEKPLYLKIASSLREAIKQGLAKPGEKIPSSRELARQFQCHRHTVMNALDELVSEGWLEPKLRSGYLVSEHFPDDYFESSTKSVQKSVGNRQYDIYPLLNHYTIPSDIKWRYSFQSGMPDLREFPINELRGHLYDALKLKGAKVLGYGRPGGDQGLIIEIEKYLRRVRGLDQRKILITHGSQEAIYLTAQLFLKKNDNVLVPSLGYPPAFKALASSGANLITVPVGEHGIDVDEVEKKLKRRKFKLIYITPLHQYPTTVTMPIPQRKKLLKLCEKYNVPILEDDYDHEFHYRSSPLPPLASDDPTGLVLYTSTFSKVLFPSARIGFMAIPESLYKPYEDLKAIVTRQNDLLLQDAIARWMSSGNFERHMRKMRKLYHERRDVMASSLDELDLDYDLPDGGMAIWVNTKKDSTRLSKIAIKNKIFVMPHSYFSHTGEGGKYLRLGFANQNPKEIKLGLKALFSL